jgi:hypothetical protein
VSASRADKREDGILLRDESGKVGRAHRAIELVIDPEGAHVYCGGVGKVDAERLHLPGNAKEALEKHVEYALADLAAKKPLHSYDKE